MMSSQVFKFKFRYNFHLALLNFSVVEVRDNIAVELAHRSEIIRLHTRLTPNGDRDGKKKFEEI